MINEMLLMGFILGLVAHDVYPEVKGRLKRLLTAEIRRPRRKRLALFIAAAILLCDRAPAQENPKPKPPTPIPHKTGRDHPRIPRKTGLDHRPSAPCGAVASPRRQDVPGGATPTSTRCAS